jgi:hypothetical protein
MSTLERRLGGDPARIATNKPKERLAGGENPAKRRRVTSAKFNLYDLNAFLQTIIVILALFGLLLAMAAAKVNGI